MLRDTDIVALVQQKKDLILEKMASWDLDQGACFSSFHFQALREWAGQSSGSVLVVLGCRAAAC